MNVIPRAAVEVAKTYGPFAVLATATLAGAYAAVASHVPARGSSEEPPAAPVAAVVQQAGCAAGIPPSERPAVFLVANEARAAEMRAVLAAETGLRRSLAEPERPARVVVAGEEAAALIYWEAYAGQLSDAAAAILDLR